MSHVLDEVLMCLLQNTSSSQAHNFERDMLSRDDQEKGKVHTAARIPQNNAWPELWIGRTHGRPDVEMQATSK